MLTLSRWFNRFVYFLDQQKRYVLTGVINLAMKNTWNCSQNLIMEDSVLRFIAHYDGADDVSRIGGCVCVGGGGGTTVTNLYLTLQALSS